MSLVNVLHMNAAGNHQCSYADNSTVQKNVMLKARKVLEDTIKDFGTEIGFSECFKLADLGCSSGPTALLSVTNIVNSIHALCQEKNLKAPDEFQVFLNDLPNNDFNTLFKRKPTFNYSKLENEKGDEKSVNCFISGVPGSFYTRLFPSKSIHFVHSSSGVHWLSQIPEKLMDSNNGNVYLAKDSPRGVYEAYFNQFKRDFTTFLRMRSVEMVPDGRMVLTLAGRNPPAKDYHIYYLLAKSLQDMLAEGLLHQEDINSFNLPLYHPSTDELEAIIESESSFSIDRLETFEINWDTRDEEEIIKSGESSGKFIAKMIRAIFEPLLASHFGHACMDEIFERYAVHATEQLSRTKIDCFNIVVSLTRKSS